MRQTNNHGFTLVEVLIVVAIFAIGTAIAIPNIMDMGRRSAVKSDARQVKDNLARARLEAIRRNQTVVVLFDQNGSNYTIFEDKNDNNAYDNGGTDPDIMITTINTRSTFDTTALATNASTPADQYISWGEKGQPTSFNVGTETISISANGDTYQVIISMMGSVQIQKQ